MALYVDVFSWRRLVTLVVKTCRHVNCHHSTSKIADLSCLYLKASDPHLANIASKYALHFINITDIGVLVSP